VTIRKSEYLADAERLYVEDGRTLDAIAAVLPLSKSTLGRWARTGDWNRKRAVYRSSPKSAVTTAVEVLNKKIAEINALPVEMIDGDLIKNLTQLVTAVDKLRRTWRPYELAVLAGVGFVDFVTHNVPDEDLRKAIFDVYGRYIEHARREE